MKSIIFLILLWANINYEFNISNFEENLKRYQFDLIGKDHLDRVWLKNNKAKEITFFSNNNEFAKIKFNDFPGIVFDLDIDYGEIYGEMSAKNIAFFKNGNFLKEFSLDEELLGLCWINNKEIALAILNNNEIKISKLNFDNGSIEELYKLLNKKYEIEIPFIYLKFREKDNLLYSYDFYNNFLIVYSLKGKKIIYQGGEEIKNKNFEYLYVIKKDFKHFDKITSKRFLIPKTTFGIDDNGNFFIYKGCMNNTSAYLEIFTLSEELKKRKYYSLKNCHKNIFYYKNYLIFFTIENSKVKDLEVFKYD